MTFIILSFHLAVRELLKKFLGRLSQGYHNIINTAITAADCIIIGLICKVDIINYQKYVTIMVLHEIVPVLILVVPHRLSFHKLNAL